MRGWAGRLRRIPPAVVVVLCLFAASAAVVQRGLGWNDASHYAQTRAFAAGTPRIDVDANTTGDRAVFRGHIYSDKAPGLAILTVPVERVARSTGPTERKRRIHLLVVFGSLLPVCLLLLLVARVADDYVPRTGALAAVALGLGTMLLPFGTVFFSHALAAFLGFAAYVAVRRADGLLGLAGGGVLAGLAVTTEYPMALLVLVLGVAALRRGDVVRRGLAYAGGVLAGLVPLLLYDWWAFGSPLRVSYSSVAVNQAGFFGLTGFRPGVILDLLFGERGLFTLTPVLAVATAGIVLLHRDGRRTEARVAAAVALLFLLYNACYYLPFGGYTPGPRFLVPVIPFLALGLVAALRRVPVLTLALGAVSAGFMVVATAVGPELAPKLPAARTWAALFLRHGQFPHATMVWFGVFALLAVVVAVRAAPHPRVNRAQLELAALGLAGWLAVLLVAPPLVKGTSLAGDLAALALVSVVAAAVVGWARRRAPELRPGLVT